MLNDPATYIKAIIGALVAGLTAVGTGLAGDNAMSTAEWVAVALAVVVAFGAVYGVTNKPVDKS